MRIALRSVIPHCRVIQLCNTNRLSVRSLPVVLHPARSLATMTSATAAPTHLKPFFVDSKKSLASDFLTFMHTSPSQFHAVATAVALLIDGGFTRIKETDDWTALLEPGGAYFYTRNQSSLVAFILPSTYSAPTSTTPSSASHPFLIVAAHTDSPVLKVKPVSAVTKVGCLQVGVECYGGGLWHTWFDRDLSVAGRLVLKGTEGKEGGGFSTRLVQVQRPVLRIPNLAIHLNREVNEKGFTFNKQTHLLPVLATIARTQLNAAASTSSPADATPNPLSSIHHSVLLQLLATAAGVPVSSIADLELSLYDTQPACLGGSEDEFIHSRALDNLMMSFISVKALIAHRSAGASAATINAVALFDNEEVGSESYQGAGASLRNFLARVHGNPLTYDAAMRRSLLVSADMAHACHPNYAEMHEEQHRPLLHHGLVIKQNANQRYATSTLTQFHLRAIAERHGIPVQRFVVRNDSACGSTIGPILSANTGIRTVDVGVPQWSMHSIRETCGVADVESAFQLFVHTFDEFERVDKHLVVEGE